MASRKVPSKRNQFRRIRSSCSFFFFSPSISLTGKNSSLCCSGHLETLTWSYGQKPCTKDGRTGSETGLRSLVHPPPWGYFGPPNPGFVSHEREVTLCLISTIVGVTSISHSHTQCLNDLRALRPSVCLPVCPASSSTTLDLNPERSTS